MELKIYMTNKIHSIEMKGNTDELLNSVCLIMRYVANEVSTKLNVSVDKLIDNFALVAKSAEMEAYMNKIKKKGVIN